MIKTKHKINLSKESRKLKQMNTRQKMGYLWQYYRRYLYLLILMGVLIFFISQVLVQRSQEVVLQGFFSNDDYEFFDADAIMEDFSHYLNLGPKQRVFFDDSLYVELDSSSEYVVGSQGKIAGYIAAKELDFLITTPVLTQHYSSRIPLMDLEVFLPKDLLTHLNDYLYYVEGVDQVKKAYAIDLSQSRFMKDENRQGQAPYYLLIPSNTRASATLFSFIKYTFDLP